MNTLAPSFSRPSITGIIAAAFGVPLIISCFQYFSGTGAYNNAFIVARETTILLYTAMFLYWMVSINRQPLSSIGLHARHWGRSLVLAFIILMVSVAVAALVLFIFSKTGISFGQGKEAQRFSNISPIVITLMVIRAGVVEEIFYRGYLMERLEKMTGKWVIYFLLPLVVFALWHYRQGIGGIIISFSLGCCTCFCLLEKKGS